MASGEEVSPRQDIFADEYGDQFIPGKSRICLVNFNNEVLIISGLRAIIGHQGQARNPSQFSGISLVITAVLANKFAHALQGGQTHRGADLSHFSVRSDIDDIVVAAEAKVAHEAHLFGQLVVVSENGSALEGVKKLCCVKA